MTRLTYRVHCGTPGLPLAETTVEALRPDTAAVLGARALGLGEVTAVGPHEQVGLWNVYGPCGYLALVAVRAVRA